MLPHLRHISHVPVRISGKVACVLCSTASADEVQARVVARVDQHPLHADEVRYFLPATERKKPVSKVAADVWKAAIELAIDRRLVVAALARHGKSASDQDVDFELQRLHRRLAQRESKIAEYLARRQISIASFRQVLLWQLTWQRYLSETVTDDNLEKYFQKKHRDFDGTQLRVAHILWKWPTGSNQQPPKFETPPGKFARPSSLANLVLPKQRHDTPLLRQPTWAERLVGSRGMNRCRQSSTKRHFS